MIIRVNYLFFCTLLLNVQKRYVNMYNINFMSFKPQVNEFASVKY